MKYINKKLTIEKINFQKIANKFGTPFYSYSYNKLKENINNFKKSFKSFSPLICFAIKSNTNVHIIKEIKISKEYKPQFDSIDLLKKRYKIWKDLYSSNKKIAPTLLA